MSHHDHEIDAVEQHRQRRRRLLATLGAGLAGAYVAPTLFSVGQAQAGHRHSHPSHSRPSWSRPSHSRPSRHDGAHRGHKRARHERHHDHDHYHRDDRRHSHREYERDRRRLRDYREDPVTIIEDIILGRPEQR
ncbi:MAG: hypothetical protein HLX48_08815 [Halomonas sp.]|uniref:hypothetical protein n=1 Tax=Halomonas sp. TaxID=1486246 RepID=UPI0017BF79AD|nr:hypothetical protein [Halomonas sp.]NWN83076.1 hypothetical protein [Halomonas sp.]